MTINEKIREIVEKYSIGDLAGMAEELIQFFKDELTAERPDWGWKSDCEQWKMTAQLNFDKLLEANAEIERLKEEITSFYGPSREYKEEAT